MLQQIDAFYEKLVHVGERHSYRTIIHGDLYWVLNILRERIPRLLAFAE
jgi:hypothetical protein